MDGDYEGEKTVLKARFFFFVSQGKIAWGNDAGGGVTEMLAWARLALIDTEGDVFVEIFPPN
ncbi:MAG TPA: hypothetical protein VH413_15170 [Verrucomicrobiae bacterium]|jgi:hypothetical protein|nr:hypothetical protein [Verrucomicrobiae bacterium]